MKRHFTASRVSIPSALLAMVLTQCASIGDKKVSADISKNDAIFLQYRWTPSELVFANQNNSGSVPYLLVNIAKSESDREGTLKINSGFHELLSTAPGLVPESVFSLEDGPRNLATLWNSAGNGRWNLLVFSYAAGKVEKVLETNSLMRPEFVYQKLGNLAISTYKDSSGNWQRRSTNIYQQRIVVAHTEWVHNKHGSFEERALVPKSADIYLWNEKQHKFDEKKGIPWTQRFDLL